MFKRIKILNEHSSEVVEHSAFVYDAKEMGQSLGLKYGELKRRMLDQVIPASSAGAGIHRKGQGVVSTVISKKASYEDSSPTI